MNKKIIFGTIVCFIFLVGVEKAFGCSCEREENLEGYLARADYVFLGTVEKIEPIEEKIRNEIFLDTDKFWKGIGTNNFVIQTTNNSAACGYPFEQNQTYLIFAYESSVGPLTTSCEANKSVDDFLPGWIFLIDNNLGFMPTSIIEFLFGIEVILIPLIVVGFVIFFLIRKERLSKRPKNLETNGELS